MLDGGMFRDQDSGMQAAASALHFQPKVRPGQGLSDGAESRVGPVLQTCKRRVGKVEK